jgi:hypothetical protein
MFNNQALAAKRKVTAAENEAALKNAKRCYVMFANTIKGSIGTQSKELIKAVSIKDVKKRRAALDVVSSAIIDEAISRIEASFAKYAAGKKKATASYGTTGMVQYDRNFMEQAVASALGERRFSDLEPFRVDSMAAIAANGIYFAIVGKFFEGVKREVDESTGRSKLVEIQKQEDGTPVEPQKRQSLKEYFRSRQLQGVRNLQGD